MPPGNIGGLVEAILGLLRDPGLRQRMGIEGRELARQRFAVERIVEQYRDLCRGLGFNGHGIAGGEPHFLTCRKKCSPFSQARGCA